VHVGWVPLVLGCCFTDSGILTDSYGISKLANLIQTQYYTSLRRFDTDSAVALGDVPGDAFCIGDWSENVGNAIPNN
jgi:hypothetical protein